MLWWLWDTPSSCWSRASRERSGHLVLVGRSCGVSLQVFVGTFAPTSTCTVVGLAVWAEALESEATTAAADESGKSCAPFLCDRMLLEKAFGDIIVPVDVRGRSGGRGGVLARVPT